MSVQSSNRENDMYGMIKKFRESYPEGRIAISISPNGECIMARARVYPCYKDEETNYLAEANMVGVLSQENSIVDVFETVQQDAVICALRGSGITIEKFAPPQKTAPVDACVEQAEYSAEGSEEKPIGEMSFDERYEAALNMPCPIGKYQGQTLGQVLCMERNAIVWVRDKFTGDNAVKEAARFLLENA